MIIRYSAVVDDTSCVEAYRQTDRQLSQRRPASGRYRRRAVLQQRLSTKMTVYDRRPGRTHAGNAKAQLE